MAIENKNQLKALLHQYKFDVEEINNKAEMVNTVT